MIAFLKRITGYPWFARPIKTVPVDAGWAQDPFYIAAKKNIQLHRLAREASKLKDDLAKAKRLKLRRRHIYAALEANTAERLRIEGGGQ